MKRVLLLGDSIRMGYDSMVKELLSDKYEVLFPEDNGRFSSYTLWQMNQYFKNEGSFDLVHWNNGYWDMNPERPMNEPIHPVEEYVSILKRMIRLIRSQNAEPVFATTTPVYKVGGAKDNTGIEAEISYQDSWVQKYNHAARILMQREQVTVNDLYALCLKGEKYYKCEDMLHLTEEGYWKIAVQTTELIRNILN